MGLEVGYYGRGPVGRRMKNPLRTRMFALWYFMIAGGFVLLAIDRWILGQRPGLIFAQFVAAAAFLLFGLMSWFSKQ
ncbi:MAG TPA: hypothetical protein VME17_04350 [Bryobacteraceae bacterium]|nr:hypothetical protein [Bryobacteraceae bacterium]